MKIKDNETGEVFEYGTNMHHALRISENGGCLTFVNLQNGDGSLKSGDGGYSFVLDDGKTPIESNSPDAINGATYANIGGFHRGSTKNDGWIPVEERLPEEPKENPVFDDKPLELYLVDMGGSYPLRAFWNGKEFTDGWSVLKVTAWMPLPEPYQREEAINEKE